jgi:phenylalanyl-tRNA synthetase beta chain
VEEIMRIDGLDNIDIPATISISPSPDNSTQSSVYREKVANMLTGYGFFEIFTNSITNSTYFDEATLESTVKMINNLSADLDVMRPSMMPTGLEVVAHNINRKNTDLCLFEFGNTYRIEAAGIYNQQKHLALYITGDAKKNAWNEKAAKADFYFAKAACERVFASLGVKRLQFEKLTDEELSPAAAIKIKNKLVGRLGLVTEKRARVFGLKQPVYYADINWDALLESREGNNFTYSEISKFPEVQRDLALVVNNNITYAAVEQMANNLQLPQLQSVKLFDIFESEKLGANKKSMAVNFIFGDQTKTLTDAEIDGMMQKIIAASEKELEAVIRK